MNDGHVLNDELDSSAVKRASMRDLELIALHLDCCRIVFVDVVVAVAVVFAVAGAYLNVDLAHTEMAHSCMEDTLLVGLFQGPGLYSVLVVGWQYDPVSSCLDWSGRDSC